MDEVLGGKYQHDLNLELTAATAILQKPFSVEELKICRSPWALYKQALMISWHSPSTVLRSSLPYLQDALSEMSMQRLGVAEGTLGLCHALIFQKIDSGSDEGFTKVGKNITGYWPQLHH